MPSVLPHNNKGVKAEFQVYQMFVCYVASLLNTSSDIKICTTVTLNKERMNPIYFHIYTPLIKLCRHVSHGKRMNPIDFVGQRSKVNVTMDKCGNKLVNMIETKTLRISLSNLGDMLTMLRGGTLLILEVKGQGHNGQI